MKRRDFVMLLSGAAAAWPLAARAQRGERVRRIGSPSAFSEVVRPRFMNASGAARRDALPGAFRNRTYANAAGQPSAAWPPSDSSTGGGDPASGSGERTA